MTLSLEANTHMEVQSLIEKIMPTDGKYNVDKYLNDDLPVCMELGNDSWEADFLKQLGREEQEVADEEEDEDELDAQPPPLKPQNFKEAVQSLEDVQQFLESRGYIEEALRIGSAMDTMTILKLNPPNRPLYMTTVIAEQSHSGLILSELTVIITNPYYILETNM